METVLVIQKKDYYKIPYIKEMEFFGWIWRGEEPLLHPDCYILHLTEEGKELLKRDEEGSA